jgi:hypothetical protein
MGKGEPARQQNNVAVDVLHMISDEPKQLAYPAPIHSTATGITGYLQNGGSLDYASQGNRRLNAENKCVMAFFPYRYDEFDN